MDDSSRVNSSKDRDFFQPFQEEKKQFNQLQKILIPLDYDSMEESFRSILGFTPLSPRHHAPSSETSPHRFGKGPCLRNVKAMVLTEKERPDLYQKRFKTQKEDILSDGQAELLNDRLLARLAIATLIAPMIPTIASPRAEKLAASLTAHLHDPLPVEEITHFIHEWNKKNGEPPPAESPDVPRRRAKSNSPRSQAHKKISSLFSHHTHDKGKTQPPSTPKSPEHTRKVSFLPTSPRASFERTFFEKERKPLESPRTLATAFSEMDNALLFMSGNEVDRLKASFIQFFVQDEELLKSDELLYSKFLQRYLQLHLFPWKLSREEFSYSLAQLQLWIDKCQIPLTIVIEEKGGKKLADLFSNDTNAAIVKVMEHLEDPLLAMRVKMENLFTDLKSFLQKIKELAQKELPIVSAMKERYPALHSPSTKDTQFLIECSKTEDFPACCKLYPTSPLLLKLSQHVSYFSELDELRSCHGFFSPIVIVHTLSSSIGYLQEYLSLLAKGLKSIVLCLEQDEEGQKWLSEIDSDGHPRRSRLEAVLNKPLSSLNDFLQCLEVIG